MGPLAFAFEYVCGGGCLLGISMLLATAFGLFRNLPGLSGLARRGLRQLLIWSYRLYRPLIGHLRPVFAEYTGVEIGQPPLRPFATAFLSVLFLLGLDLIGQWKPSILWTALASIHGALVGWLWNELEQADALRTGERVP